MSAALRHRRWVSAGLMLGLILSVVVGGLLLSPLNARAQDKAATAPAEVRQLWPTPHLQGQARLRFIGLHIYDIRLWLQEPLRGSAWAQQPLALEIAYARNLDGVKIAERSLTEMKRGGPVDEATAARWLAEMKRLFPDVKAGDRITGVYQPGQTAAFLHNGRPLGEVRDTRFAQAFFGIWLAPHSSEPQMREQLLGAP
ncbi:MAG: hypothetical protein C4K60_15545 [Ideonella sp. MAG2]|nr:MAG: hypothetical protein C4K60_15545 [Ideonella sp. MAG2]